MKEKETHHHHHSHLTTSLSTAFVIGTLLNLLFVTIEGIAGFMSNSMGLLSDAGHNLSDTISLLIAWIAFYMARKVSNKRFTYGYGKSTILASLVNACILFIAIGVIVVESIQKFWNPQIVDSGTIIWVAAVGILVNFTTALFFLKDRNKDINVKGAFLHMAMDTLVSLGVVISGIIMKYTGWTLIDPIIGLIIAFIIFCSTWNLLKESVCLSLDAVPMNIDIDEIKRNIANIAGIKDIHHIHIWALGSSLNAITIHIVLSDIDKCQKIKEEIRHRMHSYGIDHATIETEPQEYICKESNCKNSIIRN